MAASRHAAFRPDAPVSAPGRPPRAVLAALIALVVVIAGAVAVAAATVRPSDARAFDLFYGSVFLNDDTSPVAVDLSSGRPTVRLGNANAAVSAPNLGALDVVPLAGGNTLLLDPDTGEFNMVDTTGFLIKTSGGGVPLPGASGASGTRAYASGDSAYLVRRRAGGTDVYLVSAATVSGAATAVTGTGGSTGGTTRARASRTLRAVPPPFANPAATANGDLWLLTRASAGTGASTITRLSVPPGSGPGAALAVTSHGTVDGLAAVASATVDADGGGGDVVGVASSSSVRVFTATGPAVLPVDISGHVDRILPATNGAGALVFLFHSDSTGWNRVTAPTTGAGATTVTRLGAIDAAHTLAVPAQSAGSTYLMDTTDSALWSVAGDGTTRRVVGAASYPFKPGESHRLSQPRVFARGDRVIFDSRSSSQAVVVFSDGSRAARVIDKHSALAIDPAGAAALVQAHAHRAGTKSDTGTTKNKPKNPTKNKNKPAKPTPTPTPTPRATTPPPRIDNRVDCRTTTQVPHIPTLLPGQRAARSIEISWTYPRLDPTDCAASTYVVNVRTLTPGVPRARSAITVQGTTSVTLTGLFPASTYGLSVSAYINAQHSTSPQVQVTTGPEGPAAPTDVAATVDDAGNWTVSWRSCGTIAQGCVPSADWRVTPQFCDNARGLSSTPASIDVSPEAGQREFRVSYPGTDGLLGRALCFTVVGSTADGVVGDISARSNAATSWRPPVAGAFGLTASRPATTTLGSAVTTDVTLDLGANPLRDVGGLGAAITMTLDGPDGPRTQQTTYSGSGNRVTLRFAGIRAGATYSAHARVSAPGHPGSSVTVDGGTVSTRADWPRFTIDPTCVAAQPSVRLSCALRVPFAGISSAAASGERFSLGDSSFLRCGNSYRYLHQADFDPASTSPTATIDLLGSLHGPCVVAVQLVEGAGTRDPAVFGGTTSPTVTAPIDLGRPGTIKATASDFTVAFTDRSSAGRAGSAVQVAYHGTFTATQVTQLADGWSEQINAPSGAACGGTNAGQAGAPNATIDIAPTRCIDDEGGRTGWTITIGYRDVATGTRHTLTRLPVPGTPPGYVPPCTVSSANFQAVWGSSYDDPALTVRSDTSGTDLRGCSQWSYVLHHKLLRDSTCGQPDNPGAPGTGDLVIAVADNCRTALDQGSWTVVVGYLDARAKAMRTLRVTPSNDPPPPLTTPPTAPSTTTPPHLPTVPGRPPTKPPTTTPTTGQSAPPSGTRTATPGDATGTPVGAPTGTPTAAPSTGDGTVSGTGDGTGVVIDDGRGPLAYPTTGAPGAL